MPTADPPIIAASRRNALSAPRVDDITRAWLERFAACVRDRDYETARSMFDANVGSFGTWTGRMAGLDELVDRQWKNVWPRTTGFTFDVGDAFGGAANASAWIAVPWLSRALDADGSPGFERRGRATFVFRHDGDELIAVHTHFSLEPGGRL